MKFNLIDLDPTADGAEDGGSGEGGEGGDGGEGGEQKLLSQDAVDRIVRERLARERAKYADYETLKEKATKFEEIEEAQRTDLEKAQTRAAELERKAQEAERALTETKLTSAIVAEAARKNVVDPEAAVALINRGLIEFGEDGSPINIAQAMDDLLTSKPYLVRGTTRGTSADLGARERGGSKITQEQLSKMTAEERHAALVKGELNHLL